jgi:glutamate synthase domain-containing protein 3
MELVELEKLQKAEDIQTVRRMLENHASLTGSPRARAILDDWENELRWFVRVMPTDYKRVLEHQAEIEAWAASLSARTTSRA